MDVGIVANYEGYGHSFSQSAPQREHNAAYKACAYRGHEDVPNPLKGRAAQSVRRFLEGGWYHRQGIARDSGDEGQNHHGQHQSCCQDPITERWALKQGADPPNRPKRCYQKRLQGFLHKGA